MAQNPLNYTNITYDSLLEFMRSRLNSDSRFENFKESQIATTLIEMMASVIEMNNFYIERQAEEQYFDTAKRMSSAILLARNIGYSPTRPVPASTALTMTINGPLPAGLTAGSILYLNAKTQFTYDSKPFILKHTYQYTFTSTDISNGIGNPNFSKTISYGLYAGSSNYDLLVSADSLSADSVTDIELIQGEIISHVIYGDETDYVGQKFQRYKISDKTFSNLYAEDDLGYDSDDGTQEHSVNLTRVAIATYDVFAAEEAGTLVDYSDFYYTDKRTVIRPDSPLAATYISAAPICLIRSAKDQGVDIIFGDDVFAARGLTSTNENIYIQYFSTLGTDANRIGVIGEPLSTDEQFLAGAIDVSNNLTFSLKKNILGGADFEDIESIKINAPGIFYSLDRCVSKRDYISYLKSLSSPINVRNAIAWGEQEEADISGAPIKKLFNICLFSCVGELYDTTSDNYTVKMVDGTSENTSLSAVVLDDNFSPYTTLANSYFSLLIKEDVVDEINYNYNLSHSSRIYQVLSKLGTRSQITVKNVYMTPIFNEFDLIGTVYLKKLSNLAYVRKTITNAIYSWLNQNADFATPIYLSKIYEVIESNPNVSYADVSFTPYLTSAITFSYNALSGTIVDGDVSAWSPVGSEYAVSAIENVYESAISEYFASRTTLSSEEIQTLFESYTIKNTSSQKYYDISERTFWNDLIAGLYTDLKDLAGLVEHPFAESTNFENTVVKLRNSFDYAIKYGMLDDSGNIVNFTLQNQIAKVRVNLTFVYK